MSLWFAFVNVFVFFIVCLGKLLNSFCIHNKEKKHWEQKKKMMTPNKQISLSCTFIFLLLCLLCLFHSHSSLTHSLVSSIRHTMFVYKIYSPYDEVCLATTNEWMLNVIFKHSGDKVREWERNKVREKVNFPPGVFFFGVKNERFSCWADWREDTSKSLHRKENLIKAKRKPSLLWLLSDN